MWGYIIKEWNTSFIALIQKKKTNSNFRDYRSKSF